MNNRLPLYYALLNIIRLTKLYVYRILLVQCMFLSNNDDGYQFMEGMHIVRLQ